MQWQRCKLTGRERWLRCDSLCLVFVMICTAGSHRGARLLELVRGRLLEPLCLIPQSLQRPLWSSLCCPTAFYRPGHDITSLEDSLWGADPYQPICTQAAIRKTVLSQHTHTCAHVHECAKSTFTNDSCAPHRMRYRSPILVSFLAAGCYAWRFYRALKKWSTHQWKYRIKQHDRLIKGASIKRRLAKQCAMPPFNESRSFFLSLPSLSVTQCRVSTLFTFSSALDKLRHLISLLWSVRQCFYWDQSFVWDLLRCCCLPLGDACRHTPVELLKGHHSSSLRAPTCKSTEARYILVQNQWLPVKERVWEIGGRGFREAEEGGGEG